MERHEVGFGTGRTNKLRNTFPCLHKVEVTEQKAMTTGPGGKGMNTNTQHGPPSFDSGVGGKEVQALEGKEPRTMLVNPKAVEKDSAPNN